MGGLVQLRQPNEGEAELNLDQVKLALSKFALERLNGKKHRTYSWVAFKKAGLVDVEYTLSLRSLSSHSSSQLDVLGHKRDSLDVDF